MMRNIDRYKPDDRRAYDRRLADGFALLRACEDDTIDPDSHLADEDPED